MNKLIFLLISIGMILSLSNCTQNAVDSPESWKTTFNPDEDIDSQIVQMLKSGISLKEISELLNSTVNTRTSCPNGEDTCDSSFNFFINPTNNYTCENSDFFFRIDHANGTSIVSPNVPGGTGLPNCVGTDIGMTFVITSEEAGCMSFQFLLGQSSHCDVNGGSQIIDICFDYTPRVNPITGAFIPTIFNSTLGTIEFCESELDALGNPIPLYEGNHCAIDITSANSDFPFGDDTTEPCSSCTTEVVLECE